MTTLPAASPPVAARHFLAKLAFETDPADLAAEVAAGAADLVIVDTRQPWAYEQGHLPGAINLPHATIDDALAPRLDPSARYVTYCWGPACNASTRGAANLASLGFTVKELIGGLSAWEAEGFEVARAAIGSLPENEPTAASCAC